MGLSHDHRRRLSQVMSQLGRDRAAATQCPACGRKSAMKGPVIHLAPGTQKIHSLVSTCRWCGHQRETIVSQTHTEGTEK